MMPSRLKTYALTASSAAAVATASAATADIISSDGSVSIDTGNSQTLFSIDPQYHVAVSNRGSGVFSSTGYGIASVSVNGYVGLVNSGVTIGAGFTGSTQSAASNYMRVSSGVVQISSSNALALGTSQILGFAITGSGPDVYYAWINYTLERSDDGPFQYIWEINGWAYNNVAGESIIAGQTTAEGGNAVPGLGGLAALAIGAAGIRSRRQRTIA